MSGANISIYPYTPTDLTAIEDEVTQLDGEADVADITVARTADRLNALTIDALDLHTQIGLTLAAVPTLKKIGLRDVALIVSADLANGAQTALELCAVEPGNYLVGGAIYFNNRAGITSINAALISVDQYTNVSQGGYSSETYDLVGGGVLPATSFLNLNEVMNVLSPSHLQVVVSVKSDDNSPSRLFGADYTGQALGSKLWAVRIA